jgi:hypothetical protein
MTAAAIDLALLRCCKATVPVCVELPTLSRSKHLLPLFPLLLRKLWRAVFFNDSEPCGREDVRGVKSHKCTLSSTRQHDKTFGTGLCTWPLGKVGGHLRSLKSIYKMIRIEEREEIYKY